MSAVTAQLSVPMFLHMHFLAFRMPQLIYLTFTNIYLIQGGTADEQQLEQLKILYKARGSKVEDLVNEMDLLKQGMGREIRILKHQLSMAKGEIIRILHECQVWIDKSFPRVTFWHHEARFVMPNCDPRDRFVYPYLAQMMDSFSCTP